MKLRPWVQLTPTTDRGSESTGPAFAGPVKSINLTLSNDLERDADGQRQAGRRRHFLWVEFFPGDPSAPQTLRALRDGPGGGVAAFSCRANEESGEWRGTVKLVDDPFAEDETSLRATFDSIAGADSDIRPPPHLEKSRPRPTGD